MVDQEMLQAISKMMDDKMGQQMQEVKGLLAVQKDDTLHEVKDLLAVQKDDTLHEVKDLLAVQKDDTLHEVKGLLASQKTEIAHDTQLLMENYFDPKFNLLAEDMQIIKEKLEALDDPEVVDTRLTALEAMVKKINRELKELKKVQ